MLKTLRIASITAVAAAVCVVIMVAVFGLKGDSAKEAYLAQEGVIGRYTAKADNAPKKEDTVSPLVTQAKLFALRIDPPPPPPPPPGSKDSKTASTGDRPLPSSPPKPVAPPPPPVKYTLIGTAIYPEHPEKSLVLLKDIRNEYKWYRQGESLGNLTVQEIHKDRVVLYYNGQKNSELTLESPKEIKSLLKNDSSRPAFGESTTVSAPVLPAMQPPAASEAVVSQPVSSRMPSAAPRAAPTRSPVRTGERTPPPVPTVERQIESIDESIASIQEIMSREVEGVDEAEQAEAQATWKNLIELLQQEKENLQKAPASEGSDNNSMPER